MYVVLKVKTDAGNRTLIVNREHVNALETLVSTFETPDSRKLLIEDLEEMLILENLDANVVDETTIEMTDFGFRKVEEFKALSKKTEGLTKFFFTDTYSALDQEDKELLLEQLKHMLEYRATLKKRIIKLGREGDIL